MWRSTRAHLPADVVVRREGRLGVFVVEGAPGEERARFVPIAESQEGRAAPSPVPAAARVVSSGQAQLRDGQRVTISGSA